MSVASTSMALSWLLPNHSQPWLSFHTDAWVASALTLIGVFVLARSNDLISWAGSTLWVLAAACIPWFQLIFGQIHYFGIAWINSAYLLGFGMCVLVGQHWERFAPDSVADFLFLSIGIAAIVSVGLQLYQWLGLDFESAYILFSTGSRHFGNMAQPNLMASLLLLGVLASGWGFFTKRLSASVAIVLALFLLFGVALTESRTAQLNVVLLLVLVTWRRQTLGSSAFLLASWR
jgi:hypothetical protein